MFGGFSVNYSYFRLDIIVIGTGDKVVRLPEEIHREMRKNQVALEVQDTVSFNPCFIVTIHLLLIYFLLTAILFQFCGKFASVGIA